MKAKKKFVIIAYDVQNNKRRRIIAKLLDKHGIRVNRSVFECMISPTQLEKLKTEIATRIDPKKDQIIYYTICLDCYTNIVYQPEKRTKYERVNVV